MEGLEAQTKTLPRMTTLNQAILNAGEAKIFKGKISF